MRASLRALLLAGLVGAIGLPLSGCGSPPVSVCVPTLAVSPENPRPGRVVTVKTVHPCPVNLPEGAVWHVRIRPDDATVPLAQAEVRPEADGSFEVSITVPPTIRPGRAIAWISDYWDYAECPDRASCASAEVGFEVAEQRPPEGR